MTGVDRNLDKNLLDRLAEGRWIKRGKNLLVTGPAGAGKSYLVSALGHQACQIGMKTLYYNCTKFWPQIRQSRARDRYEKEIKTISQCDLLILDDFGFTCLPVRQAGRQGKLEGPDRLTFLENLGSDPNLGTGLFSSHF